jgi:hypothetical protein
MAFGRAEKILFCSLSPGDFRRGLSRIAASRLVFFEEPAEICLLTAGTRLRLRSGRLLRTVRHE